MKNNSNSLEKKRKLGSFPLLIWIPFAIFTLYLILVYSVNFPSDDQWDGEVPFLQKFFTGQATFKDLLAQQLDHRISVHRLVGIAVAYIFDWDVRYHIGITFLMTCFSAVGLALLCIKLDKKGLPTFLSAYFLSLAILFAPFQIEAWTNPMMGANYLTCFVIWGIFLATNCASFRLAYWGCFLLALLSTFTFTGGVLAWFVFALALGSNSPGKKSFYRTQYFAGWVFGCLLFGLVYFNDFSLSSESPGVLVALQNPFQVALFFFVAIGSPFAQGTSVDPIIQGFIVGFFVSLVFFYFTIVYFLHRFFKLPCQKYNAIEPWCLLGIIPFLLVALSALGRFQNGPEMALASRYGTYGILLTICTIFILGSLATQNALSSDSKNITGKQLTNNLLDGKGFFHSFFVSVIAILITLHIFSCFSIFPHYGMMRSLKTNAKAALMFTKFIVDRDLLGPIWRHESMDPLYPRVEFLEKMGFLTPKRVESLKISSFATALPDFGQSQVGEFDGAAKISENQFQLSGWAVSNDGSRPADSVLLTREFPGQEPEVFALARVGFPRQEIADKLNRKSTLRSGWAKQVSIDETTSSNLVLKAWALDTTTGKITPLSGSVNLSGNKYEN